MYYLQALYFLYKATKRFFYKRIEISPIFYILNMQLSLQALS